MNINEILKSGEVVRYHSNPHIANQKLCEHEWKVALLLQRFYPNCSKNALLVALTHDAAEMYTGDAPSPAKKRSPELKTLLDRLEEQFNEDLGIKFDISKEEEYNIKNCDILEGLVYTATRIINHGEKLAIECFEKWCDYYRSRVTTLEMDDFVIPFILAVEKEFK